MNTRMKHSRVSDEWLAQIIAKNPVGPILGADGRPNGNYSTGPVRLAWTQHLFTPRPPKANGKPTYDCSVLFPPGVDLTVLQQAALVMLEANFAKFKLPQGGYNGLEPIFHDQATKANFEGYTSGGVYLNVSTQFKPQIVEPSRTGGAAGVFNPITEEARVYPGVWAIVAVNPYSYGVSPPQPKKGVKFGIQGICIIQDDQSFGGAGIDPRTAFAGISVTNDTNIAGMFNQPMGGQPIAGMAQPQHAMPAASGMSPEQMRELGLA